MIRAGILATALAALLLGTGTAQALTLQQVGPSFDQPIYVTSDPDDAGRLFVVERGGTIRLLENGSTSLFADLTSEVACPVNSCEGEGERGLLSIALDPDFAANGRLYADYASASDGTIHIDELVTAPDGKTASVVGPVATIPHGEAKTHNGGQLQFGPDGMLYVSTGDGGGANDQFHHAQGQKDPLGKILRVEPGSVPPYSVWSLGLRNPYRFSFDALSGDMVIADVGQGLREEIDFAPSPFPGLTGGQDANYGWNCREGFLAGPGDDLPPGQCATASFVDPVFDYDHSPDPDLAGPGRCAVTGGYVVRDPGLGALYGHYVYADFCAGAIRSLLLPGSPKGRALDDCSLGLRVNNPVSFGEDAARRLYVVEKGGRVLRFAGLPPAKCPTVPPLPSPSPNSPQAKFSPTFVGIKPQRRRVERGKVALLTVWVSPCAGRKGEPVTLLRNGHANGTKYLSRACTARFVPRVRRGTTFAAFTREDRADGYLAGKSRKLTIRLAHRHHR